MSGINVIDQQGKAQGTMTLEAPLSAKEISPQSFAAAVRVQLQNWRQGTVGVKGRSDVAFSTKKPWRQKGTGRARVGAKSSPLWRKGGIIFGPQPRIRELKVPAKVRAHVLNNLFFEAQNEKRITCLDLTLEVPATKTAANVLKVHGIYGQRIVLFASYDDIATIASFRNIPGVLLLGFDEPNIYDLANATHWLFLKKDTEAFTSMVSRWN